MYIFDISVYGRTTVRKYGHITVLSYGCTMDTGVQIYRYGCSMFFTNSHICTGIVCLLFIPCTVVHANQHIQMLSSLCRSRCT